MRITEKGLFFLVGIMVLGLIVSGASVSAKAVYKSGDVIKIIVPFSPGGGYDRACRLIAPHLEKEMERITGSDLTVIIVNVTGAGGVKGYSRMFRSKPDGKTIGMVGLAAAPYQQLVTGLFDLGTFTYIAIVNRDPAVMVVKKDLPINTFQDFIKRSHEKPILISTSGKGASENIESLLTKALLEKHGIKLNVDFVHYRGSAPAFLAVIKGEAEAKMATESSSYPHVKNGDIKPIAMYSKNRGRLLSDCPTLAEQQVPGADEMSSVLGMIRLIVAPPETPEEATKVLREAMLNSLRNPALVEKANKMQLPIDPETGEAARQAALKRLETAKKYQKIILATFK